MLGPWKRGEKFQDQLSKLDLGEPQCSYIVDDATVPGARSPSELENLPEAQTAQVAALWPPA